ncbi:MAG: hypothetical protein ABIJ41_08280 [Candidatus Omnitrophota bacterium]
MQKNIFLKKTFVLLLLIMVGIWILWPTNNAELYFSQSDNGRDLYGFMKTAQGGIPYRDYRWEYGPLMPYYYALFYRIFSTSIQTTLIAQNLLILLSGLVVFLTCSVFFSGLLSFVCATWFWAFQGEFFYTYNHSGGVLALLIILYYLTKYIKESKLSFAHWGFLWTFLLCLIRPNMGLMALGLLVFCLFLTDILNKDQNRKSNLRRYIILFPFVLIAAGFIYWLLLRPLPAYYVRQCFHYVQSLKTARNPTIEKSTSPWIYMVCVIFFNFTGTWIRKAFSVLIVLCALRLFVLLTQKKFKEEEKMKVVLVLCSFALFAFFSLHEMFTSGYIYRLNWSLPSAIVGLFFLLGFSLETLKPSWIKLVCFLTLLFLSISFIMNHHRLVASVKNPEHLLSIGQNKIYVANPSEWIQTVTQVTSFLKEYVPPEEKILVLRYAPLYYFLSGHDCVIPETALHKNMPREQEERILEALDDNRVNYIVVTNQVSFDQQGMLDFGRKKDPSLALTLHRQFREIASYGNWDKKAQWAENHAVKIFKRLPSLK